MSAPEAHPPMPEGAPNSASPVEQWEQTLAFAEKAMPRVAAVFDARCAEASPNETVHDRDGREHYTEKALKTRTITPDVFIVGLMRRKGGLRSLLSPYQPVEEKPIAAWTVATREVAVADADDSLDVPPSIEGFDDEDFDVSPAPADDGETAAPAKTTRTQRVVVTEHGKTYLVEGNAIHVGDPSDPIRIPVPRPRKDSDLDKIGKYRDLKRNKGVFDDGLTITRLTPAEARKQEEADGNTITPQTVVNGIRAFVKAAGIKTASQSKSQ